SCEQTDMPQSPLPGWSEREKPVAGGAPNSPSEPGTAGDDKAASAAIAPSASKEELLDQLLGDFRILRRLGRGGMAEVYLAEQTQLKRNVAVKVLHKDRVTDAGYLKRFKTEAMAAGSLSHPNIIQVITIGEQEGIHYIAQEYVAGMNLR